MEYNLPSSINITDDYEVNIWLNDTFKWNNDTDFWFQSSPICNEPIDLLPNKLGEFMARNRTKCEYGCNESTVWSFCPPRNFGNGRCDLLCNSNECYLDNGDCSQLCFSNYTECTWDLFTNNQCDQECNNEYCSVYVYQSGFTRQKAGCDETEYCRDLGNCVSVSYSNNTIATNTTLTEETCEIFGASIYNDVDRFGHVCDPQWINNGLCDDSCRHAGCGYDEIDCSLECIDDYCSWVYWVWNFMAITLNNVNHDTICAVWQPIAEAIFDPNFEKPESPVHADYAECMEICMTHDYNNDGYMNFREFTAFGFAIYVDRVNNNDKINQINCSSCVDMKIIIHYIHQRIIYTF